MAIVSHGAPELLRRCLRSFETTVDSKPRQVVVVDSGSPDETPEMVARDFPWVELIRRGNIGFAAGQQPGAAGAGLRVRPAAQPRHRAARRGAGELPRAHGRGSRDRHGRLQARAALGRARPRLQALVSDAVVRPRPLHGVGRSDSAPARLSQYRATDLGEDEPGPVDAVNGAFMLVRAKAIREVGLLDEGYWLYMEDLDWCYRFWQRGWTVFYEPSGVVLHVKGGTSGERRGLRQEVAFHRGMGRFYRKFYAPNGSPLTAALVYLGSA